MRFSETYDDSKHDLFCDNQTISKQNPNLKEEATVEVEQIEIEELEEYEIAGSTENNIQEYIDSSSNS